MAELIKNGAIVADTWKVVTLAANETAADVWLPWGSLLVPLAVWRARRADLVQREWEHGHALGVWLEPEDDPAELAPHFADLSVIGVRFPAPNDGRGYSIAALLRTRHGWQGELRALGNVGRDQIYFLHRVGFDSFAVDAPELALAGLEDFSVALQPAANQPLPRRDAGVGGAR